MLTVESLGRRPLLLIGVSSIVASLLALAGSQLALTGQAETWTSVAALLLYVGAYQVRAVVYLCSSCTVQRIVCLAVRGKGVGYMSLALALARPRFHWHHVSAQVSFGPISWLIVGEIFPLAVRGQAAAVATVTNFGSNFLASLFEPLRCSSWGQ